MIQRCTGLTLVVTTKTMGFAFRVKNTRVIVAGCNTHKTCALRMVGVLRFGPRYRSPNSEFGRLGRGHNCALQTLREQQKGRQEGWSLQGHPAQNIGVLHG